MSSHQYAFESMPEVQLIALLRAIQTRLGTGGEQPGDLRQAQLIAHEINNLRTVSQLQRGLSKAAGQARASACLV